VKVESGGSHENDLSFLKAFAGEGRFFVEKGFSFLKAKGPFVISFFKA